MVMNAVGGSVGLYEIGGGTYFDMVDPLRKANKIVMK